MAAEAYNATGAVKTLVGNWQEEGVLLEQTGTSRARVSDDSVLLPTHTGRHARVLTVAAAAHTL
jgi:hypothetical protein